MLYLEVCLFIKSASNRKNKNTLRQLLSLFDYDEKNTVLSEFVDERITYRENLLSSGNTQKKPTKNSGLFLVE